MAELHAYTDGGCWGNPGPGGWAWVVKAEGGDLEKSSFDPATTNNRMELSAVISVLEWASTQEGDARMVIHTDSQYVKNGITQWIHSWLKNSWKTASKDPVKNKDLWIRLHELDRAVRPEWKWVKGHAGHPENERCDQLVQEAIGRGKEG